MVTARPPAAGGAASADGPSRSAVAARQIARAARVTSAAA